MVGLGQSKCNTNIHVRTGLMYSKPLSDRVGRDVYLKLENTQPSGSFKLRGLSHLCKQKYEEGYTKFVGSSGGNAGLALAYSAKKLGVPCQIYVPKYVSPRMIARLKSYGASVTSGGIDWKEANDEALKEVNNDPSVAYIPPYDHPTIWYGNSTMVDELHDELEGVRPSCIVASVGGGGMLLGIMEGMERNDWKDIPILAMETEGADCFNKSIKANRLVALEKVTSIAKTLAARAVATKLFETYHDFNIISEVLPDKDAVNACINLADDHGFLVEPSCGVTMAAIYSNVLPAVFTSTEYELTDGPIIMICCGGSDVTPEMLFEFKKKFNIGEI